MRKKKHKIKNSQQELHNIDQSKNIALFRRVRAFRISRNELDSFKIRREINAQPRQPKGRRNIWFDLINERYLSERCTC